MKLKNKWCSCHSGARCQQKFQKIWKYHSLRVVTGDWQKNSILSDFDETQNKWCSCHSGAKCQQKFQRIWKYHSLRVVTGDWQKNSILSDFDETQNKWCLAILEQNSTKVSK